MAQIKRKWIEDAAIDHIKLDSSDSYSVVDLTTTRDLHVDQDATVLGNLYLAHGLTVNSLHTTYDATIDGNLIVIGDTTATDIVADTLNLSGNATIDEDLSVLGDSSVSGDSTVIGYLKVFKDLRVASDTSVAGILYSLDSSVSRDLRVGVDASVAKTFYSLDATIGRDLKVIGDASVVGGISTSSMVVSDETSGYKKSLFSTDQMSLSQLEGGAYFGRVGITENQYDVTNFGTNWISTQTDATRYWRGVAMSSDGKYQTAVTGSDYSLTKSNDYLYTSSDFGVTWAARDATRSWVAVAMSSDGKMQLAAASSYPAPPPSGQGSLYLSTDYGKNWATTNAPTKIWRGLAMSSDGRYQSAVNTGGLGGSNFTYTSSDFGQTWISRGSVGGSTIAMSSDGRVQTSAAGDVYTSSNYGQTWILRTGYNHPWLGLAMSSDGKYQTGVIGVIGGSPVPVYVSSDFGITWVPKGSSQNYWNTTAMSSNGKIQMAGVAGAGDKIYLSTDYGENWATTNAPTKIWWGLAMSSDGKIQLAGAFGDYLYLSYATSQLQGNLNVGQDASVAGIFHSLDSSVARSLNVAGLDLYKADAYYIDASTTIMVLDAGALQINAPTYIGNDSTVSQNLTVYQDTSTGRNLAVAGGASVTGNLNVSGDTTTRNLKVTGDASVVGDIKILGDTSCAGEVYAYSNFRERNRNVNLGEWDSTTTYGGNIVGDSGSYDSTAKLQYTVIGKTVFVLCNASIVAYAGGQSQANLHYPGSYPATSDFTNYISDIISRIGIDPCTLIGLTTAYCALIKDTPTFMQGQTYNYDFQFFYKTSA